MFNKTLAKTGYAFGVAGFAYSSYFKQQSKATADSLKPQTVFAWG
jgi:hypothetical protein